MRRLLALLAAAGMLAAASPSLAQVTNAATTNGSVTIAAGNTFQTVLAALPAGNAPRRSLTIENNNTTSTETCWVFVGGGNATKGTSILLIAPGGSYTRYYPYVPSDAIQATCVSTSDTLYVDTQ